MALLPLFIACYSLLTVAFSLSPSALSTSSQDVDDMPNARHIFNAIHSSMRQWGSSLNHNGMSFFLAAVPKDTQFYHGRGSETPVAGMDWLAFEPEHAMLFAVAFDRPPDDPQKPPKDSKDDESMLMQDNIKWWPQLILTDSTSLSTQDPLDNRPHPGRPRNLRPGWLHTYSTNKDLNLLYIDGMSAGKSRKGTLDSQDNVLLNESPPDKIWNDPQRARKLCAMARDRWSGRIDGFLRMEAGFEIILCSFLDSLDVVRITRALLPKSMRRAGPGMGRMDGGDFFSYYQAITARYNGIGGNRVALNYDKFVTAFEYSGLDLFTSPDGRPRLQNVSQDNLHQIMGDLDDPVMDTEFLAPTERSLNWQAIADEVVERYSKRLWSLTSIEFSNATDLTADLNRLLRPFVDYDDRNESAEIERCSLQFIPHSKLDHNGTLAKRAIQSISREICATVLSASKSDSMERAIGELRNLIQKLNWTTWKHCAGGCESNEICLTPIWPYGSVEDGKTPNCVNSSAFLGHRGYWDFKVSTVEGIFGK